MKTIKNIIKNIFNTIIFAMGAKAALANESANDGICDFGGQGRNEYGK